MSVSGRYITIRGRSIIGKPISQESFNPDNVPGLALWWDFGDPLYTEYATTGNLNVRTVKDKKNSSIQATFAGTSLNRFTKTILGTLPNGQPRVGLRYNSANRDNISFAPDIYGNVGKNVIQHHVFWAGRVTNYINNRAWCEFERLSPTIQSRNIVGNLQGVDAFNGRFRFLNFSLSSGGTFVNWDERYPTSPLTDFTTSDQVAYKGGADGAGTLIGTPPLLPSASTDVIVRIGTTDTNRFVQNSVVYEYLIYTGSMSKQNKDLIVQYLRDKWGI